MQNYASLQTVHYSGNKLFVGLFSNYLMSCSFFSWMRENANGKGRRKWGPAGVHV